MNIVTRLTLREQKSDFLNPDSVLRRAPEIRILI